MNMHGQILETRFEKARKRTPIPWTIPRKSVIEHDAYIKECDGYRRRKWKGPAGDQDQGNDSISITWATKAPR